MTMTSLSLPSGLPDPVARPEFYAGVPFKRAIAWLADVVVILTLSILVLPLTAFTGVFFFGFLFLVVGFLYRWVTIARGSATWGMRLLAIELRNAHGARFDPTEAFLHTAGYTVSIAVAPLQLISIALMLITEKGQGLTDHVMGSAAVNRPE